MKKYKAIFFDWDGTAVRSRTAPVKDIVPVMEALLRQKVILIVVSGTTYENIAGGALHNGMEEAAQNCLYLGLGRGAYNYGIQEGEPVLLKSMIPDQKEVLKLHDTAYGLHRSLLERYGIETDIVFSRPNYCKVDLLSNYSRHDALYRQNSEVILVNQYLKGNGCKGGLAEVIQMGYEAAESCGQKVKITTDAKYLEIGPTTKSDNVDFFMEEILNPLGIRAEDCCFWGDEFSEVDDGIPGSDAWMITEKSEKSDFFDVGSEPMRLPDRVESVGGGVERFLEFLKGQI